MFIINYIKEFICKHSDLNPKQVAAGLPILQAVPSCALAGSTRQAASLAAADLARRPVRAACSLPRSRPGLLSSLCTGLAPGKAIYTAENLSLKR